MRLLAVLCILFLPCASAALEVTGLRIDSKGGTDHISLRLSDKAESKIFSVEEGAPRVVVDLPAAHWRGGVELPPHYSGTLIRNLRYGFHDAATSRLVFDLNAPARPRNIELMGSEVTGSYWLEFDLVPRGAAADARKEKHAAAAEAPRAKGGDKPVIVIDAGHGGQDPGTSGEDTYEKDITLRYARALMDALLKTGRYRVALTREDDRYLFLRDRVKRARAAHGSLFISLHADSAPTRSARGLSVYTISEKASDKESEALAAKENKADVIGGMDLSDTSQDVADILIDLAGRETRAKSAQFADLAVKDLGQEVNLLSNTHRFAGFAVLKAPDIPSVLIEVGFLTNPREEHMLNSDAYENKVVHALVRAIDTYFSRQK